MITSQFVGTPPTIAPNLKINLVMVKRKLMDSEEGEGWTLAQADFAVEEYTRFLQIVKEFGNAVPNRIMDTVWHYHILDTKAYAEDTMRIFGEFVHHYPYFGMNGEDDYQDLMNSFETTQAHYLELFGEALSRENGLFDIPESGHCNVCKCTCNRCNRG